MTCPLCPLVAQLEEPILAHLLREHPRMLTYASLALAVGPFALRKRPDLLVPYYLILLLGAVAVSADQH